MDKRIHVIIILLDSGRDREGTGNRRGLQGLLQSTETYCTWSSPSTTLVKGRKVSASTTGRAVCLQQGGEGKEGREGKNDGE